MGDRIALAVEPKANSQRSLAESTKGGWVREISSGQSQLDVSKKKKKKIKASGGCRGRETGRGSQPHPRYWDQFLK